LIIYKRKDGTGWYHPKKFADVQQAWAAVRSEYVKAFELAQAGDWEGIDKLDLLSDKSITLKAVYIYFPELLLPVYSAKHLVHFLEKLGVPKSEWRNMGRAAQNRRLLSMMHSYPECANWSGLQMMWFLYDWAPLPTDKNKIAPPFDQMFEDEEDANWAFDFLSDIATRMGVQGPKDKRSAFTIRQVGKQWKLRFIFANWVIAEVVSREGALEEVGLTLPRGEYSTAEESYSYRTLADEAPYSFYSLSIEDARMLKPEYQVALDQTISDLSVRLKDRRTPAYANAYPPVAEAMFDPSQRPSLFKMGLPLPPPPPPPPSQRYWKIAPGEKAWQWEECLREGFIGIGWDEIGDVSGLTQDELVARWNQIAPSQAWGSGGLSMLSRFAKIKPGDRIVANRGMKEVLGIGTVTGGYYYAPEGEQRHRLNVKWDDTTARTVNKPGWVPTLIELNETDFNEIAGFSTTIKEDANPPQQIQPVYPLDVCAATLCMDVEALSTWVRAIERKKQAVFYGPPGTGKTFVARHLAKHLIGGGDGFEELVQFHPAYAYEDFIQGIRPMSRPDGGLDYPMMKGRFLDFCERAGKRTGKCVLIVDEINRANLARVFGELMYLLEYRNESIPLAGGGSLRIPDNVLILGTMNTADRSIALVDHALRRRFAFIALQPNFDVLRTFHTSTGFNPERLIQLLQGLNQHIDDSNYAIGTSFFLRQTLKHDLPDIWRMEIEPYLEEYFFDQPDRVRQYRWAQVKEQLQQ
jgi:5-methylcytosine-specific restriction protein B